jgi:hypothetical protein
MTNTGRKRPFGKVTLTFIALVICLLLITITVGSLYFNETNEINSLQNQITSLQVSNSQLQTNYSSLQSQYNQLNNQYQQLKTSSGSSSTSNSQLSELQSQINSLQLQLANATAVIARLQGPTGILPTYSDLAYVGPTGSGGAYWLQLTLKNTGSVPINRIYVTINSVQISIPFTYLDSTVSANNPLPESQSTTGKLNVTPPINNVGTYPLVIQAVATNGTTYTYETTITAH